MCQIPASATHTEVTAFLDAEAANLPAAVRHLEAAIQVSLGEAHLDHDLDAARRDLDQAAALRTTVPDAYAIANLERALGDLEQRAGNRAAATGHWREAARRYDAVNATTEADQARDRLTDRQRRR